MSLSIDERKAVISYRVQKAHGSLEEARAVAGLGFWSLAANRLYYASFYMASALLIDKGLSAQTHGGVIHLIGYHFVTKGLLPREYGKLLSRLYEMRQSGDYDDLFDYDEAEIEPLFGKVEAFIRTMEELITTTA